MGAASINKGGGGDALADPVSDNHHTTTERN